MLDKWKENNYKMSDAELLDRGGILVPQEQVLAYAVALVLRHHILVEKGNGANQVSRPIGAQNLRMEKRRGRRA